MHQTRAFAALRPSLALLALSLAAVGCGRTPPTSSAEKAGEALTAARAAEQQAAAAGSTADGLEARVGANEEGLQGVREDVVSLEAGQGALDERVSSLELGVGGAVDDAVAVDDAAAAGFSPADEVTTVEEGFFVLNERSTTHATRITSLEAEVDDFPDTVVQVVNQELTNGNIVVEADLGFTAPAVEVDPRAEPDDEYPEYPDSTTLHEAIMGLRYANQIRFQAPEENTRLGELYDDTVRSYVQEAIAVLDRDLYDLVAGNLSPALDTTDLPQDGTFDDVQSAVESLYADSQPYILGPHPTPTTAALSFDTLFGVEAGTAMCRDAFAAYTTAHMCSPEEVLRALGQNRYAGVIDDVVAWTPVFEGDSCQGLMSDDAATNGSTLTVDLDYVAATTGNTGKHAFVTRAVACNTELAVLCCR